MLWMQEETGVVKDHDAVWKVLAQEDTAILAHRFGNLCLTTTGKEIREISKSQPHRDNSGPSRAGPSSLDPRDPQNPTRSVWSTQVSGEEKPREQNR